MQGYFFKQISGGKDSPYLYNYTRVRKKNPQGDFMDFPICVTLSESEIRFSGNFTKIEKEEQRYRSGLLFSIPIDAKDGLIEDFLKNIYAQNKKKPKQDGELILYERSDTQVGYCSFVKKKPKIQNEICPVEIFLDFLFDFLYSNAFSTHPLYGKLYNFFISNPVYKTLIAKLEYHYYQDLNEARYKLNQEQTDNDKLFKDHLHKEKVKATSKWLAILIDTNTNKFIQEKLGWFKHVEQEHREVYKKNRHDEKTEIDLSENAKDSIEWLNKRYGLLQAYQLQFLHVLKLWWIPLILLTIFGLLLLVYISRAFFKELYESPFEIGVSVMLSMAFAVFALMFLLVNFFKTLVDTGTFKKAIEAIPSAILIIPKLIKFFKPRILIGSISVWAFLTISPLWLTNFTNTSVFYITILALTLGIIIFIWGKLSSLIKTIEKGSKLWNLFLRAGFIVFLAYIYSFTTGLIFMGRTAESHFSKDDNLKNYFLDLRDKTGDYSFVRDSTASEEVKNLLTKVENNNEDKSDSLSVPDKLDKIISLVSEKEDINKKLFEQIPNLEKGKMICFDNSNKTLATILPKKIILLPKTLIFYTLIALIIGVFTEIAFKEKFE